MYYLGNKIMVHHKLSEVKSKISLDIEIKFLRSNSFFSQKKEIRVEKVYDFFLCWQT